MSTVLLQILAACIIVAVHVYSPRLTFLHAVPRSAWLSAAGGIALAYVFVHVLPELAERQLAHVTDQQSLLGQERELFLLALAGLLSFYGLDRLVSMAPGGAQADNGGAPPGVFWGHIASFALYNGLIGYLIVHRDHGGWAGLAAYSGTMAVHFVVNDRAMYRHHGAQYVAAGRWILAVAVFAGLAAGLATTIPDLVVSLLFAYLAGAIILNVMKEELPEQRESAFSALLAGAVGYSALLALI